MGISEYAYRTQSMYFTWRTSHNKTNELESTGQVAMDILDIPMDIQSEEHRVVLRPC